MATKRTHSAMDMVHPSRQTQVPGSARPLKKRRRVEPPVHKKQVHASSVNTIKKHIRDVKRRLERSQNLPATIRVDDERALAAYEQEFTAAHEEKTRQKMIKKYHMVRFFERQKATRKLKKLRRLLLEAKSQEEVEDIKTKMHLAEVDLNYTQYHPLYQRYISLYPPKDGDGIETSIQDVHMEDSTNKPPMWAEVEKRMVDGTLSQLRNSTGIIITGHEGSHNSNIPQVQSRAVSVQAKLKSTPAKYSEGRANPKESVRHSEHLNSDRGKRKEPQKFPESSDKDNDSDAGFFEE